MSQHDLSIANQGFPAFRSDLNDALQALGSMQSGTSAPSTTYANMLWYDTTNNIVKMRNEDNDAWISLFTLDQSADEIASVLVGSGSASSPSIADVADTNTGVYFPAANKVGITTDGTERVIVDSSGNVGIGTSSPSSFGGYTTTSIGGTNKGLLTIRNAGGSDGGFVYCNGTDFRVESQAGFPLNLISPSAQPIVFTNVSTERMRIDSSGTLILNQGQIKFPATQNASSDANTLDDYEEGTWTPSLGGNATYTELAGSYVKVGRIVIASFAVTVGTLGTGSNNQISGLPFTGGGSTYGQGGQIGYYTSLASSVTSLYARVDLGQATIQFAASTAAATGLNAGLAIFGNGARVIGSTVYQTS